jgi:hypothetical protein
MSHFETVSGNQTHWLLPSFPLHDKIKMLMILICTEAKEWIKRKR